MKLIDYTKTRESQRSLADKLGITPVLISQWANAQRPVPPERCVEIEMATGGEVVRQDLRPDDWQKIWPELAVPDGRRATSAAPAAGHAGRQPPTTNNMLDTVPDRAAVVGATGENA